MNRMTLVLFIVLCLEAGIALTLLPWVSLNGAGDWGNNFILNLISQNLGLPLIQQVVASGWVRGAVTALGLLNLFIAFWEIAHFGQSLQHLEEKDSTRQ